MRSQKLTHAQYEVILNEYRTAQTSDERNTALRALGRARDPALIAKTLSLPLSNEVKGQDIYLPLGGLRTHADGISILWDWMKQHWSELERKLPPGLTMLGTVVSLCTSGFTHDRQVDEVKAFFAERSTKGFDQSLAQSHDAVVAKARWLQRDTDDVKKWLGDNGYST